MLLNVPSNVDIATLKAEFLYQYQETNGYSFRNKLFANNVQYNKLGSIIPALTNAVLNTPFAKAAMGIAQKRSVPKLAPKTLKKWIKKQPTTSHQKVVYFFCDEFTNFYDVEIGKDAFHLLDRLGYQLRLIDHEESGRSFISKGFLKEAKAVCNTNVAIF